MRKTRAKSRPILPDPRFNNVDVTRFVNNMMLDGKKSIAYQIFYSAIDIVQERLKDENALEVWKKSG